MMRIKKLFVAALLLVAPLALTAQENSDWANTSKYVQANAEVTVRPRAVLFGALKAGRKKTLTSLRLIII